VDTYKLRAPAGTGPVTLNVLVWGTGSTPLNPRVRVYDAAGTPVAFRVLANDAGVFSVEVRDAAPGATHYVSVAARTPGGANATGGYFLGADFNHFDAVTPTSVAAGTVSPGATAAGTLTVTRGAVFQFGLSAEALGVSGGTVTMTVYDADGRAVFTLEATAGQPLATTVRYLATGTYTVRYTTRGASAPVGFGLYLLELSDDAGPYKSNTTTRQPSSSPSSSPPPSSSTTTQSAPPPSSDGYTISESSADGTGYSYGGSSGSGTRGTPYYY